MSGQIRPGVLVQILSAPNPEHRQHAGEIHVVGEMAKRLFNGDEPAWHMDPPILHCGGRMNLQWTAKYLRVLRNPGDDEQDESLRYLPPAPTSTKVPEGVPA
jgi:hypothetical protein